MRYYFEFVRVGSRSRFALGLPLCLSKVKPQTACMETEVRFYHLAICTVTR